MSSGSRKRFLLYMLVPAMVLFGFFFDVQFIEEVVPNFKLFRPSFIGSAAFDHCLALLLDAGGSLSRAGIYFGTDILLFPNT